MASIVEYLKWDSDFFDFPVFKLNYTNDIDTEKLFSVNVHENVLYYVFSENILISKNVLSNYNGKLVDEKVVLNKQGLQLKKNIKNKIELYSEITPNANLYRLAKISGQYSRYKTDKRLPSFTFKNMYDLWIENSCKNENSVVYVCKHKNDIVGFITLDISLNSGKIGLIAVDDNMQGKGIGYELMCKAENHLVGLGIDNISVATQKSNKKALNFYVKLGYSVDTTSNIYHFILKKKNSENSF